MRAARLRALRATASAFSLPPGADSVASSEVLSSSASCVAASNASRRSISAGLMLALPPLLARRVSQCVHRAAEERPPHLLQRGAVDAAVQKRKRGDGQVQSGGGPAKVGSGSADGRERGSER